MGPSAAPIVAEATVSVLAWFASRDLSNSAPIGLLSAGEAQVGLASGTASEGVLLGAEGADVGVATWAGLPADWANAIVALLALWIAQSGIIFLASRAGRHWASDTTAMTLNPASIVSALSKGECIIKVVVNGDCLSAGCESSRKNDLSCVLHF